MLLNVAMDENPDNGADIAEEKKCLLDCEEKSAQVGAKSLLEILFVASTSGCGSMEPASATRISIFYFSCLILS
jgi:hypothetical protein